MTFLMYLISLPLAVSTIAVLYEFLDRAQSAVTLRRLAGRFAIMLLMYLAAQNAALLGLLAGFTTIVVLHLAAFWAFRLAVRQSGS
jgi:hypothetical protein